MPRPGVPFISAWVLLLCGGCSYTAHHRWMNSSIGTQLIATKPFPKDPQAEAGPAWPVGTRLRVARVRKEHAFLQVSWYTYARVVGDPQQRLYSVDDTSTFLPLPDDPPGWFDASDPRRSARSATLEELEDAIDARKGLASLAALEVVRRWAARDPVDRLRARLVFRSAMNDPHREQAFAAAINELTPAEFDSLRGELVEMLRERDEVSRQSDRHLPYYLAQSVRHRLGAVSATQP